MNIDTWWLVVAALAGPVLAVQAQKWVERLREGRLRRTNLFFTLMATRATRLSFEHVRALNMIDIEFYERRGVIDAWRIYHDHLNQQNVGPHQISAWVAKGDDLFIDLLYAMSREVGYDFDKVHLRRGSYTPRAHGDEETIQREIRDSLVKILSGAKPFPITVTSIAQEEGAPQRQQEIQQMLSDILSGKKPLQVIIKNDEPKGALGEPKGAF